MKEHGDYATSIALQLAKPAGRPPRHVADLLAGRAACGRRDRRRRGRRSRLPQPAARPGVARAGGAPGPGAGRRVRQQLLRGRSEREPRVRVGQPDRADPHRRRPLGRGRRRARPPARGERREGRPRVLLQRPRRADRPVRTVPARRCQGRAAARGRLRRRLRRRHRAGGPRRGARRARAGRSAGGLPRGSASSACSARSRPACTTSASTSTSTSTRTRCTSRAPSSAPSSGCARSGASTRPTARCGCAPPTSATTRTASSSRATASRPTSRGDLAYYLDKRERGFDRVLILLGADHHGYIGRLMAMCAAFGDTPGVHLQILIGQMVNLLRDGEPMRMSKRAGTVIRLEDLVEAIGVDAARYALARSSADSTLDIDLDLWSRRSSDNPVYYVQYAATRAASVLRNAAEMGIAEPDPESVDLVAAEPPPRERPAAGARRVPAGDRDRRRAARAAPRRALPRGEGGQVGAALLGRLPGAAQGRRGGRTDHRAAAAAVARDPGRCWRTACACSA